MPRGPCWSQHEVSRLLAQIKGSREVTLLMASTSRPNEALWRDIARRLTAEGYERNVSQCRAKWKKLKQSFYSDWEARRQGGSQSLCSPLHYKIMKRLWKVAGRPVFGVRRLPDVGNRDGSRGRRKSWPEMDRLSLLGDEQDSHERGIRSERALTWMEEHQNSLSQVHVYSLGMLQVKEEEDDEDEEEMLRPSSATMPWDMRSAVEQEGLSCPELSPVREAVNTMGGHRPPSAQEHYSYRANAGTPSPPALHLAKSEPQSSTLSAGVSEVQTSSSPLLHADTSFSRLLSMKQESRDHGPALLPEQETLPPVPLEETALEDQTAAVDLQAPVVVSLLQNMQQILAQLLHTSQQQQVLLESLASDTVSHLHVISDNLVQVGETLHELLIRVHNCDDIQ